MKIVGAALLLSVWVAAGQGQEAAPQFEVASVKLNASCGNGRGMGGRPNPGRLTIECSTVDNLIQGAYVVFAHGQTPNMKRVQVLGGPAWTKTEMYSVAAKAEDAAPLTKMYGPMLRALLEERFKLKLHTENKDAPVYALTVAKGGSKLKQTPEGSCKPLDMDNLPEMPARGGPMPNMCGNQRMSGNGKTMSMKATGVTLEQLTGGMLSNFLDRPVIDKTGLTGMFDVEMEFAPENRGFGGRGGDGAGMPAAAEPEGPTVFMALAKLGLKLEQTTGPVETIVIDHIERPSEN
jgi:uncharacterized protein (TIGR03435 family)